MLDFKIREFLCNFLNYIVYINEKFYYCDLINFFSCIFCLEGLEI